MSEQQLTWRGKQLSPDVVIDLWKSGATSRCVESRKRIEKCRALRRKELTVQLAWTWRERNPEAALWVGAVLPERTTLERDLKARVGAVEPIYAREPLDETKTAASEAESLEAYMNEWRQRSVPYEAFVGKGVEDGEYARITIPSDLDLDGMPDFFDKLTERAHAALDADARGSYRPDDVKKQRYVKVDEAGNKAFNPAYERDAQGRSRKEAGAAFRRDAAKSEDAHAEAVRRYLLSRQASVTRLIPALDCVPYFARGTGRARWELAALVERTLYDREELLSAGYGWVGMGDAKLLPRGYGGTRYAGKGGQLYLYTAYLVSRDDEGHERPLICYTVGGAGTWTAERVPDAEDAPQHLAVIDLFANYGLEGACWSYHGGLHTEDDEPDHYYQPYLWPRVEELLELEGIKTSINAATVTNAFTGHVYTPDAALLAQDANAALDAEGALRRPRSPAPGEIEPAAGAVVPFAQAQVGQDAWRVFQTDLESLRAGTAGDVGQSGPAASGHAQVVASEIAQVAKRHVREGAKDAVVACGQDHLRILHAIEKKWGVRWPLPTTNERAAGERPSLSVAEFDPAWLGESPNYLLKADYPEEENLARVDLEANLYERKLASFEDVQKARAKTDSLAERQAIMEDGLWAMPETQLEYALTVAQLRQDPIMIKAMVLKKQQALTQSGVPGMPNGVPTAAIKPPGGGGPFQAAARVRAGEQSGEMGTASRLADANAQMAVGPGAAPQQGAA